MTKRREFLQHGSLIAGVSVFSLDSGLSLAAQEKRDQDPPWEIVRQSPTRMYDGRRCWCHPRAGIVPAAGVAGAPRVVATMNTLDVSGSDVFKSVFGFETNDLGASFSKPAELPDLATRKERIDNVERPVAVSDFWPTWHRASKRLLGTGHTVVYTPDWKVKNPRPRHTSYSVYNAATSKWAAWKKLAMPGGAKYQDCGAGCTQRFDLDDGGILLPMYFRPPGKNSRVIVSHCAFDGETLTFQDHGNEMFVDDKTRGLHEPSLTRFAGQYFLTVRNDNRGYVTRSKDGLRFEPLQVWRFDDEKELGNYNTQQHWVAHSDKLYLVYTRRGADNDHVFRHRAPLFIAEVDPERLRVMRSTEQILVPERGARLGNFGVTAVSPLETWVTVAEWMQTWGPNHVMPVKNKYGSDGSVWVARIKWRRPNEAFSA